MIRSDRLPEDVPPDELIALYLRSSRANLDLIEQGLQGHEGPDLEVLQRLSHSLKGSSLQFGFPEPSDLGAAMEALATALRQPAHRFEIEDAGVFSEAIRAFRDLLDALALDRPAPDVEAIRARLEERSRCPTAARAAGKKPFGARFRVDLESIEHLPDLPQVVTRILALVDDPAVSAEELASMAGQDQSMVASILRMVNSPFYRRAEPVASIHHAIVILGARTIRNMALSAVLVRTFGEGARDRRFNRVLLWRHSVACATGAELLAGRVGRVDPDQAFLAGLMHDMGILILDQYYHAGFRIVLDAVLSGGRPLVEVEAEVFGLDHAVVGGALARKWNFPDAICEAIACHHAPSRARKDPALAAVVHLAGALLAPEAEKAPPAEWIGATVQPGTAATGSRDPKAPPADSTAIAIWDIGTPDSAAAAMVGLTEAHVAAAREDFKTEWEQAQAFLSLLD